MRPFFPPGRLPSIYRAKISLELPFTRNLIGSQACRLHVLWDGSEKNLILSAHVDFTKNYPYTDGVSSLLPTIVEHLLANKSSTEPR